MKTGCFKYIEEEKNNGFISISLYPSNNDLVKFEYKSLVPNWKLFDNLKSKKISKEKFILSYMEQLDSLDAKRVFEKISRQKEKAMEITWKKKSTKRKNHSYNVAHQTPSSAMARP